MNPNKYKVNKYVFFINEGDEYYIYNGLTGYLYRISCKKFMELQKLKREPFLLKDIKDFNTEEKSVLIEKHFLLPLNVDEIQIGKYYFDQMRRQQVKFLNLVICPTLRCNLACTYCFEENRKKRSDMSFLVMNKIIHWIIKYCKEHDVKSITIQWYGGEPLLRFQSIEYFLQKLEENINIEKLKTVERVRSIIITNGTLLTDEIFKKIAKLKMEAVQICFDGDKETHDKMRIYKNGKGSFNLIYRNLKKGVMKYKQIKFFIRINVTKENVQSIKKLIKRMGKDNLYQSNVFVEMKPVMASPFNTSFSAFDCLGNLESYEVIYELYKELANNGYRFSHLPFVYNTCGAIMESSFVIDPEGYLYKCDEVVGLNEYAVGHVSKGVDIAKLSKWMYTNAWDSPQEFKECFSCELLPYCFGGCVFPVVVNKGKPRCREFRGILPKIISLYVKYRR